MSPLDTRLNESVKTKLPGDVPRRRLGGTWQQRDWRAKLLMSLAHQLIQSFPPRSFDDLNAAPRHRSTPEHA